MEIESHLRKQWSGMFYDFLKNREVREQINVAKVMLSTLQTSSEKMEELVKGLYIATKTDETEEILGNIDVKYAAIKFFKIILEEEEDKSDAYLGYDYEIDKLSEVDPSNLSWSEYLVALECFHDGIFDNGEEEPEFTIDFCGPGVTSYAGFILDRDEGPHNDKQKYYEQGVKQLNYEQRKEVISKFVMKKNANQ